MNGENHKRIVGSKDYFITDSGHLFRRVDKYQFEPVPMYEGAPNGYFYTNVMMRNGKQWTGTVHGLVAKYFLKKPRGSRKYEIGHLDNNKQNNAASNLCFMSHERNMQLGWQQGLFKNVSKAISKKRAQLNGNKTNLTDDDVRKIRDLKKKGFTNKQLGYIYNLHEMQISRIANYRSFANVK